MFETPTGRSSDLLEPQLVAHRAWSAEIETLAQVTAEGEQRADLIRGLDSFRDDPDAQCSRQLDDHPHKGSFTPAPRQAVDERLGDFQHVERKGMQVAERRVAG